MASSHDLERQNNDSLSALSSKVSALRSVTNDIYANARDQGVIDSTSETFSTMTTSMKGSARRLGVMARNGDKVAVMKVAGIIVVSVVVLWWIVGWICKAFGLEFGLATASEPSQAPTYANFEPGASLLISKDSRLITQPCHILAIGPVMVFTLLSSYVAAMFRYYVYGQNPTPLESYFAMTANVKKSLTKAKVSRRPFTASSVR
ncbi:hypothetical protein B0A48_15651 [Cryoendolithus antarcticus]|uniref:t-SNARE coiled-coil homology domain-containing protein n=1 Tax=Cryoendolithus antarcticus TaxID=1507870 RepID=A0A1V8SH17_9PEZI|nr:hypothetical protein B0A48_15651 [Cryoendolithus antarcticus]